MKKADVRDVNFDCQLTSEFTFIKPTLLQRADVRCIAIIIYNWNPKFLEWLVAKSLRRMVESLNELTNLLSNYYSEGSDV